MDTEQSGSLRAEFQQEEVHVQRAILSTPELLHLIVMPTEQCNFRCTYCYEDFEAGQMKPAVVGAVKALLARRAPKLRALRLGWFGGEPLLAHRVVAEVTAFAAALAASRPGLAFQADVTSNAWLLKPPLFAALTAAGIGAWQITLDGAPADHDRARRRADGRGSFEQIWANLLAIRDSDAPVTVMLRLHLSPDNAGGLDALIALLRRELLPDRRFTTHLHAVGRWGGPNDAQLAVFDPQQTGPLVAAVHQALYAGLRPDRLAPAPPRSPAARACYAARANAMLIRADGRLARCTLALRDPRNTVGALLPDGRVQLDPDKLAPWLRGLEDLDEGALTCPYQGL